MNKLENVNTNLELRSALKYSPRIFLLFGILAYLATGKIGFLSLTAYVIATEIIVLLLKNFSMNYFSKDINMRPVGSNCGAAGYTISDSGMPSGHTAVAAMFATFLIARMWVTVGFDIFKILRTVLLIAIVALVMYSRVEFENCHTWPQVLVGALLGILLGLLFWWVSKLPVLRTLTAF